MPVTGAGSAISVLFMYGIRIAFPMTSAHVKMCWPRIMSDFISTALQWQGSVPPLWGISTPCSPTSGRGSAQGGVLNPCRNSSLQSLRASQKFEHWSQRSQKQSVAQQSCLWDTNFKIKFGIRWPTDHFFRPTNTLMSFWSLPGRRLDSGYKLLIVNLYLTKFKNSL